MPAFKYAAALSTSLNRKYICVFVSTPYTNCFRHASQVATNATLASKTRAVVEYVFAEQCGHDMSVTRESLFEKQIMGYVARKQMSSADVSAWLRN